MVRIAIVPGNGVGNVERSNWYSWVRHQMHAPPSVEVALREMPDPLYAKESIWHPFMEEELGCGPDTIIVGHSSGAAAAMRFAETRKVKGLVLVSAYTTDQGCDVEATSGYFSRPWKWEEIKRNAGFIVQFASEDDHLLPWSEQMEVATSLNLELKAFKDRGHFQDECFPELVEVLKAKLDLLSPATAPVAGLAE